MRSVAAERDVDLALVDRLGDPAFFLTPDFHPLLREMRRNAPVAWSQAWEDRGFWSVTRYHDLRDMMLQPQLFSSQQYGSVLPADPHMYDTEEARRAGGIGMIPTFSDPPRHDDVRKALQKPFGPAVVAKLADACQKVCDDLVDSVIDRGECEFVEDIASRVPMNIICMMMGLPQPDWAEMHRYVSALIANTDPERQLGSSPAETIQIAQKWQFDYLREAVRARRSAPTDDVMSLAALAKVGDELIPEEEIVWWVWAFLIGGFETSRNVMSGGLLALIEHPDHAEQLRREPEGEREAADELTRWASPSHQVMRVATADTEIGGQKIRAGDWVMGWLISANRDETVFDQPFTLNLRRKPNPHFSFGYGPHNCIGRNVALLEIRHIIMTMLRRLKNIEVAGEIERVSSCFGTGIKRLPIRFAAR